MCQRTVFLKKRTNAASVVTLKSAWARPVRCRWRWGVQRCPISSTFSLRSLSGWCWPYSKRTVFRSWGLIKSGPLMGLMTSARSVCAPRQMRPRKVSAGPLCPLSINYIWLCQINCMELFAADRRQVDSGGGGLGRMPCGCLWIVIVCLPCPFLPLLVCSCASDCSCKLWFWTQTQIALS